MLRAIFVEIARRFQFCGACCSLVGVGVGVETQMVQPVLADGSPIYLDDASSHAYPWTTARQARTCMCHACEQFLGKPRRSAVDLSSGIVMIQCHVQPFTCHRIPLSSENHHLSKALGAIATTTTKLAIIKAVATAETITIVPRLAGNLPLIT